MFDFEVTYVVDGYRSIEFVMADDEVEAKNLFLRAHPCLRILSIKNSSLGE